MKTPGQVAHETFHETLTSLGVATNGGWAPLKDERKLAWEKAAAAVAPKTGGFAAAAMRTRPVELVPPKYAMSEAVSILFLDKIFGKVPEMQTTEDRLIGAQTELEELREDVGALNDCLSKEREACATAEATLLRVQADEIDMVRQRDSARGERDAASDMVRQAREERDLMKRQRDDARVERDAAKNALESVAREVDRVRVERDAALRDLRTTCDKFDTAIAVIDQLEGGFGGPFEVQRMSASGRVQINVVDNRALLGHPPESVSMSVYKTSLPPTYGLINGYRRGAHR
jgi:predicted  nucleic acid-binding Zn-ribbon protein